MKLHYSYYSITLTRTGKNIFTFVLFSNLIGLIPYSFTTTSHLIVTFTLSLSIFIGINIICVQKHKFQMLSLFIPSNTSFGLVLLLVPIELLSYVFKLISLVSFTTKKLIVQIYHYLITLKKKFIYLL